MTNIESVSTDWAKLAAELAAETDPDRRRQLVDEMHAAYLGAPSALSGATSGGLPYPSPTDPIAQGADAIRALAEAADKSRVFAYKYVTMAYTLANASMGNLPGATLDVTLKAGQTYLIRATMNAGNAASGNSKTVSFRIVENGVLVGTQQTFASPFVVGSTYNTNTIYVPLTAAADGVKTYQVQGYANAASSCSVGSAEIEAINLPAGSLLLADDLPTVEEIEAQLAAEREALGE